MPTDLAHHIEATPLVDTHEHLRKEPDWLEDGPDILQDLFGNYVPLTSTRRVHRQTRCSD